jgi:hypothetical protein
MLRPLIAASALALVVAAPAAQAELSYSYVELGVASSETDTVLGAQDAPAIEASASYEILSYFHVFGGYRSIDFDDLPVTSNLATLGAGVNYDFTPRSSIFFNLAALSASSDVVGATAVGIDDDGYGYTFGYREANRSGRMEFLLSAEHLEFDGVDYADTRLHMGLLFKVTKRFNVDTDLQWVGDENAFKVGVRYYLPNRLAKSK